MAPKMKFTPPKRAAAPNKNRGGFGPQPQPHSLDTYRQLSTASTPSFGGSISEAGSSDRTILASPRSSSEAMAPGPVKAIADQAERLVREGNLDIAEKLYRKAVENQEAALAEATAAVESSTWSSALMDALRAASGLARVLRLQGKYEEAEVIYRSSLTRAEGWLGPRHVSTLKLVNFLALLLSDVADPEAVALFRRALTGFEAVLGPSHPDTLSIVSNLANFYADCGDLEEAASLYTRALKGLETSLGLNHPATCSTMNGLASILAEMGKLDEAGPMFTKALQGYEASLGAGHPETLASVHNLATMLLDLEQPEAAEALFRRALDGRESALGKTHPATIATVHGFARLMRMKGEEKESAALLKRFGQEAAVAVLADPTDELLGTPPQKTPPVPPSVATLSIS